MTSHLVLLSPRRKARIKYKKGINLTEEMEESNQDNDDKWNREGNEVAHSIGNPITEYRNTQSRRRWWFIVYCRAVADKVLVWYMPYLWIDNSFSRERKGRCTGIIIIICMVSIEQYIINRSTWHTVLTATSSRMDNHEWSLHCHMCAKLFVSTWHHDIEQSAIAPNRTYMLK